MTDQERPVEERNELPGDLPAAAPGVAVVEAEVPPQQQAIESPSPPTAETTDDVGGAQRTEVSRHRPQPKQQVTPGGMQRMKASHRLTAAKGRRPITLTPRR
jgi:hypothetical protein